MIVKVLALLFFMIGCSSAPSVSTAAGEGISFSKVQKLVLDRSSKSEVAGILGEPQSQITEGHRDVWTYKHPLKNSERLTAYFDRSSQTLTYFIWIPDASQQEINLDVAISRFNPRDFIPGPDVDKSAHGRPSPTVSLFNPKTGVSLLYEKETKDVLAIVYAGVAVRTPSDSSGK